MKKILFVLPIICMSKPLLAGNKGLSLQDVIHAALENNHVLQIEKISPQIEKQNVILEQSSFDTKFVAGGSTANQDYEEDEQSSSYSVNVGLQKTLSYGTDLSLSFEHSTVEMESGGQDGDGEVSSGELKITQPLLHGRGQDAVLRGVKSAREDLAIAELSLKSTLIETVSQAGKLYWQYCYMLSDLEVQRESLNLAKESQIEMEEKIRLGTAAKLDLLQSQSEVASREESVIVAENNVENSKDELFNYIYGRVSDNRILPCFDTPSLEKQQFAEKQLIRQALEHRPDYLKALHQENKTEIDVAYYKNQKLPDLDLSLTLGVNKGEGDDTVASLQMDPYRDYQYGALGLSFEIPVGNRFDNASYAAALLRKRQQKLSTDELKSQIFYEVRTALRDVKASRKRHKAAALSSKYAQEALKTEEERYRSGLSTNYQVLLNQRDLTDARSKEVDAIMDYQTSLISLYQAAGITLQKNSIKVE